MIARTLTFYRRWISPALHAIHGSAGACRFVPSCSEYAAGAVQQHGALAGSGLALWRLARCNPFSRGGFDPVPGTYHAPSDSPECPTGQSAGVQARQDSATSYPVIQKQTNESNPENGERELLRKHGNADDSGHLAI